MPLSYKYLRVPNSLPFRSLLHQQWLSSIVFQRHHLRSLTYFQTTNDSCILQTYVLDVNILHRHYSTRYPNFNILSIRQALWMSQAALVPTWHFQSSDHSRVYTLWSKYYPWCTYNYLWPSCVFFFVTDFRNFEVMVSVVKCSVGLNYHVWFWML